LKSKWSQLVTLVSASKTAEPLHQNAGARLPSAAQRWRGGSAREILPGLLLASASTAASLVFRTPPGMTTFSPQTYHNIVGTTAWAKQSVTLGLRRRLRIAIALLGVRLPCGQVFEVGGRNLGIIAATVLATFAVAEAGASIIAATTLTIALAVMGPGTDV
jgi:hypothetical protein